MSCLKYSMHLPLDQQGHSSEHKHGVFNYEVALTGTLHWTYHFTLGFLWSHPSLYWLPPHISVFFLLPLVAIWEMISARPWNSPWLLFLVDQPEGSCAIIEGFPVAFVVPPNLVMLKWSLRAPIVRRRWVTSSLVNPRMFQVKISPLLASIPWEDDMSAIFVRHWGNGLETRLTGINPPECDPLLKSAFDEMPLSKQHTISWPLEAPQGSHITLQCLNLWWAQAFVVAVAMGPRNIVIFNLIHWSPWLQKKDDLLQGGRHT